MGKSLPCRALPGLTLSPSPRTPPCSGEGAVCVCGPFTSLLWRRGGGLGVPHPVPWLPGGLNSQPSLPPDPSSSAFPPRPQPLPSATTITNVLISPHTPISKDTSSLGLSRPCPHGGCWGHPPTGPRSSQPPYTDIQRHSTQCSDPTSPSLKPTYPPSGPVAWHWET